MHELLARSVLRLKVLCFRFRAGPFPVWRYSSYAEVSSLLEGLRAFRTTASRGPGPKASGY